MNVWQATIRALRGEKTEYVFAFPGGELFYDAPETKTVLVKDMNNRRI